MCLPDGHRPHLSSACRFDCIDKWLVMKAVNLVHSQSPDPSAPATSPSFQAGTCLCCSLPRGGCTVGHSAASRPLLAIIMPTWNRASFLKMAIDSVLSRSWRNPELIVVHDGSTDESTAILEDSGKRITVINMARDGLAECRGCRRDPKPAPGGGYVALMPGDLAYGPLLRTDLKPVLGVGRRSPGVSRADLPAAPACRIQE